MANSVSIGGVPKVKRPKRSTRARANRPKKPRDQTKGQGTRRTMGQLVKRDQQIVVDREVFFLTWTAIAEKHNISDKTAREGYKRYIDEIAPLLDGEDALDTAREFIRKLQGIQRRFAVMAQEAKNEGVQLSALRELVNTMCREIELRQALGLMPKKLGELVVVGEIRFVAEQIIELFDRFEVPDAMYDELRAVMSGSRDN